MNNSYFGNVPPITSPDVCPIGQSQFTDEELQAEFPKRLSNSGLTQDEATGRIPVHLLQQQYNTLLGAGIIKPTPVKYVGGGETTTTEPDTLQQQKDDSDLYNRFREEYCFYEQRYRFALRNFLEKSTSRMSNDNTDAQKYLNFTVRLNRSLNSLIEFMNYMSSMRVDTTNSYVASVNSLNKTIEERRKDLQNVANILTKNNGIINVQKEMVNFTSEKNRYVTNQISVWAALNVLALATIFYVYRST